MDSAIPSTVKTALFCLSTSSIKTRVHFFPSAGASTSHQPITCVLSLFGKGIEKRSVMLDGGRLNQPDGVRLEDAFPSLRGEASGIFGLELQLSSQQGRANLLNCRPLLSSCRLNLHSSITARLLSRRVILRARWWVRA